MKSIKLWSENDDKVLVSLVEKLGQKWIRISESLKQEYGIERSAKQCRERWFNNLKIRNNNGDKFSSSEASIVFTHFFVYGAKWAKISRKLKTKSENQIKNFMNATLRRNIRNFNKGKSESEMISISNIELLNVPGFKELLLLDKNIDCRSLKSQFLTDEMKEAMANLDTRRNRTGVNQDRTQLMESHESNTEATKEEDLEELFDIDSYLDLR